MDLLAFDEQGLVARLERCSEIGRVAFAAAAATRLLNGCQVAADGQFTEALEKAWASLRGGSNSVDLEQTARDLLDLFATGNRLSDLLGTVWEDVAASVAYALRAAATKEAQEAAWAARRVYEALDQFVIDLQEIDINERASEKTIVGDPIIQTELQRQERDLNEISGERQNVNIMVDSVRKRAVAERALPATEA